MLGAYVVRYGLHRYYLKLIKIQIIVEQFKVRFRLLYGHFDSPKRISNTVIDFNIITVYPEIVSRCVNNIIVTYTSFCTTQIVLLSRCRDTKYSPL